MFPAAAHKLNELFTQNGHQIRAVGGWVRDKLCGITPKDLDFATTARPEQMVALCDANGIPYSDSGLKHGTVGIILDHEMFEVTTLRIDRVTDGRHAEVEYTTDWQQDALRRDFTFNAMSMDLAGNVYDYFDGRRHLDERKVIFVGDPVARIQEDYLRILRYFRFCGRVGDWNGWWSYRHILSQNVDGFRQISRERVWMEMSKILVGENLSQVLDGMYAIGLFKHIGLPDVDTIFKTAVPDTEGTVVWTGPVCRRAAMVWAATRNPVTVLVALTPDRNVAEEWKLSRDERLLLHWLQERRDTTPTLEQCKGVATSRLGHAYAVEWAALHGPSAVLSAIKAWEVPVFPVQGQDMIERFGMSPGPSMGVALRALEQRWRDSDFQLTKGELLETVDG